MLFVIHWSVSEQHSVVTSREFASKRMIKIRRWFSSEEETRVERMWRWGRPRRGGASERYIS